MAGFSSFFGTAASGPVLARVALRFVANRKASVGESGHSSRRDASGGEIRGGPRMSAQFGSLDPNRLTVEQAARVLSTSGRKLVTVEMLQRDVEAGGPTNADGTINLIHFAAWIVKEMASDA